MRTCHNALFMGLDFPPLGVDGREESFSSGSGDADRPVRCCWLPGWRGRRERRDRPATAGGDVRAEIRPQTPILRLAGLGPPADSTTTLQIPTRPRRAGRHHGDDRPEALRLATWDRVYRGNGAVKNSLTRR